MLTQEQINNQRAAMRAQGLKPSVGKPSRQKFAANGPSLVEGDYTPAIEGEQIATEMPARGRDGRPYDAIQFKNKDGNTVYIGLGSIYNSIRIVKDMDASKLVRGAYWQGEKAQPTMVAFRYGALSDMPSQDVVDETSPSGYTAQYTPSKFTLVKKVVYVEPRFVKDNNRPIFDEQCRLRTACVVGDIEKWIDENAVN